MLATLATYKSFKSKFTASYCVMCVTLIGLPFKIENCDQYHLFFYSRSVHFSKCFDYSVLTYSFGLVKNQSLHFYFKYIVLYEQLNNPYIQF